MKILIDIPEEDYNECKMQADFIKQEGMISGNLNLMLKIFVANGTPLPKGHGRLIDASQEVEVQLYDDMYEGYTEEKMTVEDYLYKYTNGFETVIEADNGE